ncbi:MAG: vanadium-dependent haloperoxidase [Pseudomonadota bacterium]
MTAHRRQTAHAIRVEAANLALHREHPAHLANGDEQRYAGAHYAMSFTKGLQHDPTTGLVANPHDFEAFRAAIDNGTIDDFTDNVDVPDTFPVSADELNRMRRRWEAPTAGVVYDLQGPDAQAVTMAPAPALGSTELAYEMAEVYELAMLRDEVFTAFETGGSGAAVEDSANRLNAVPYPLDGSAGRPRRHEAGALTRQTAFRGSSPGVDVGPYLSQFMLIGTWSRAEGSELAEAGRVARGEISYGTITISQKTLKALHGHDYMQSALTWREVQDGFDPKKRPTTPVTEEYVARGGEPYRRFISTPRDLATYVHYDALYEAYLNACLILLETNAPLDPAFNTLSAGGGESHRTTTGFALYGGPHILSLVTEVATRALKAVRFQKFNSHIRLRPEALAGRLAHADAIEAAGFHDLAGKLAMIEAAAPQTVEAVKAFNGNGTAFLPMAFPEGSPMHPAYGAGHATVAGACVTMLKAFFDTSAVFVEPHMTHCEGSFKEPRFTRACANDRPVEFVPHLQDKDTDMEASTLLRRERDLPLTLEGELNKLAANISIGRNMAGVHYFTDYYDSLRMGESIALGLLEEQALCYRTDPFVLSVPTFDGDVVRIGRR